MSEVKNSVNRRKHERFIKRLTTTFFVDHSSFRGISSNLSESGLFIRTNRGFPVNTPIDIELLLPNNKVSFLKGIVRRTTRTPISSIKNGMGIEIIEKDETFIDFVKFFIGRKETDTAENNAEPEFQTISCLHCGVENKDLKNTMQERRRHKRLKVENMKVDSEMPSASEVKIIDISMGGVLVKADRRLNIGNKYALKIGYKDRVLFVKATVAWALLVGSVEEANGNFTPLYIAGMQFTDVSHGKIEEIVNFIELDMRADPVQFSSNRERHAEFMHLNHNTFSEKDYIEEEGDTLPDIAPEEISIESETESSGEFIEIIDDIYSKYENNNLSYYGILQINDFANPEEIKKAYYKRVKEFHPDRHSYLSSEMKEKLNALFACLTEAYDILMNSENKEKYDRNLIYKQTVTVSNKELAHEEFEHGKIEFWNGNLLEAERFFLKAVYFDNSSGKYFYFYAKTLLKLGKLHEAEKAIKKALDIDPSNSDYLIEAGYIYHAMNLSYRARDNFEMALRIQPSNIKAQEGIAGLKSKKENSGFRYNIYNPIKAFKQTIIK